MSSGLEILTLTPSGIGHVTVGNLGLAQRRTNVTRRLASAAARACPRGQLPATRSTRPAGRGLASWGASHSLPARPAAPWAGCWEAQQCRQKYGGRDGDDFPAGEMQHGWCPVSLLGGFALGADRWMPPRSTRTLTFSPTSTCISLSSTILVTLPIRPPWVITVSPLATLRQHLLMLLGLALLRADEQEIEHAHDQDERQDHADEITSTGGSAWAINISDEHISANWPGERVKRLR